jgi:hypothetical protein
MKVTSTEVEDSGIALAGSDHVEKGTEGAGVDVSDGRALQADFLTGSGTKWH